jgi:myo-inositol-1(or 4)-monophosphatase
MASGEALLPICLEAATAGGRELTAWQGRVTAREKGPRDYVTEADLASQRAIRAVIAAHCPAHEFIGEESQVEENFALAGWQWFVDPLDGTTNFVHDLPYFAVSVAVALDGRVLAGVVLDPVGNECFSAARGAGAHLGDVKLSTSGAKTLSEALLAFSLPSRVAPGDPELIEFAHLAPKCRALRRFGAAALNLSYVAAGRLDGYWARRLHAWDLAAGSLIVEEAGGAIASWGKSGVELTDPGLTAAASEPLHDELRRELL